MKPVRFALKEEHIKLLRKANVGWNDVEAGAPEIDPKRPYGNSDVISHVLEILGWNKATITTQGRSEEVTLNWENAPAWLRAAAEQVHRETEMALDIVLFFGAFEAGVYEKRGWREWVRIS